VDEFHQRDGENRNRLSTRLAGPDRVKKRKITAIAWPLVAVFFVSTEIS
jgi:hypothetical protein